MRFARELAGQQAGCHRAVDDDPDVVGGAERQQLGFDPLIQHAVRRLQRSDGMDRLGAAHLADAEVGRARVADLALLDHAGDLGPRLFHVGVGVGPVDLVEVDHVHAQPAQAALRLLAHARRLQPVEDRALGRVIPDQAALRRQDHAIAAPLERLADDFLRVAQAVGGRGVDPVDPRVEAGLDGRDRFVVVLRPPAEVPRPADGPRAEADRGEVEVGVA